MKRNKKLDKLRPTCACGEKMVLHGYVGYYDRFKYWECPKRDCNFADYENFEAEDSWNGGYV